MIFVKDRAAARCKPPGALRTLRGARRAAGPCSSLCYETYIHFEIPITIYFFF